MHCHALLHRCTLLTSFFWLARRSRPAAYGLMHIMLASLTSCSYNFVIVTQANTRCKQHKRLRLMYVGGCFNEQHAQQMKCPTLGCGVVCCVNQHVANPALTAVYCYAPLCLASGRGTPRQTIQQQHVSRKQAHLEQAAQLSSPPAGWC